MGQEVIVAGVSEDHKGLRAFLETPTITAYLQKILPPSLSPARLVRQALTLAFKNPDLLKCSQASLWAGLVQAAELGLELSGPLGQAYLVPRWNGKANCHEATFQVGYRGLVALAFRSGKIESFPLREVYEHDTFSICYGSYGQIKHEPLLKGERGAVIGYYAVARFLNGGNDFEYLSVEEAQAFRRKYAPKNRVWDSEFDEMAKKTCARALCKRLPLCVEAQQAAMMDEYHEKGIFTHRGEAPHLPLDRGGRTDAMAERLALPEEPVMAGSEQAPDAAPDA